MSSFFIDRENLKFIFGSILKKRQISIKDIPTSTKAELLNVISNEMQILYNKIDQNKIKNKTPTELEGPLRKLNDQIINSVINSFNFNAKPQQPSQPQSQLNGFNPHNTHPGFAPVVSNNMQNQFNPMLNQPINQQINDRYVIDDDDVNSGNRLDRYIEERNTSIPQQQRAPVNGIPDFLVPMDKYGKKDYKNAPQLQGNKQMQQRQSPVQQQQPINNDQLYQQRQGMNGNFDLSGKKTPNDNYNSPILEQYKPSNQVDAMAYNVVDNYTSNLNDFTTGVDHRLIDNFKEQNINSAYKQMENIRNTQMTKSENNKSSSINNLFNNQNQDQHSNIALPDQKQHVLSAGRHRYPEEVSEKINESLSERATEAKNAYNAIVSNKNIDHIEQMYENQIMLANEVKYLKSQLNINKSNNSNDYIDGVSRRTLAEQNEAQQITALNAELLQTKNTNILLHAKLDELKTKTEHIDVDKLNLLEQKKAEILNELGKIKEEYHKIEHATKKQEEIEKIITHKKEEVMAAIQKYDYKIFGGEHDFYIEYINLEKLDIDKPIYRYKLPYKLNNVTRLALIDQNFNKNIFNISPYNNKMIFADIGDFETKIDKIEDINYKYFKTNHSYLELLIEPGNYELEKLIIELNLVLNKYEIEIGYDPTKYIVQIRSKKQHQFMLIKNQYDIYDMLGFTITENKSDKFRGNKAFDLKTNKILSCFAVNLDDKKPFAKVSLINDKIIGNIGLIIKPFINELEYIDFYFTNENNRPFWQEYNNFNMTIIISGVIAEEDKDIAYENHMTHSKQ